MKYMRLEMEIARKSILGRMLLRYSEICQNSNHVV